MLEEGNEYYTLLTGSAFVAKLQQVQKEVGTNWSFDGWVPHKYMKEENEWTAVFKKGTGDKREEAAIRFTLDPNKTLANAWAELDANDFEIQVFKEADIPDFAGIGVYEFTSANSALKATFETDAFVTMVEQELGISAGVLEQLEPERFKTKTLADGTKRHTVVIRTGEGQSDLIELIVNEDAAGNYEIIDAQNFNQAVQEYYSDGTEKPAWKELEATDFFYKEFEKSTFKDKLKTVAKAEGGTWDFDGYTPAKMDRDGENYTILMKKGDDEVEVKFKASGEDIETALGNLQAGDFVIADFKDPDAPAEDDSATKLFTTVSMLAAVLFMSS